MSVGAICFTSSGSNGSRPVFLVIFLVNRFFFPKKARFPPYTTYTPPPLPPKKRARNFHLNYFFGV